MKIYKIIDLFSGIGGIRKGYEMTGRFKNVLSADIDKYACIVYKHLYNDNSYYDVSSISFKTLISNIDYDVLLAGFPCQSFSIAGLKQGFSSKKYGSLFFDIADILKITHPKAFMLENVVGLLKNNNGKTFEIIVKTLDEIGYKIIGVNINNGIVTYNSKDLIRDAQNFGIPQKRSRVFIIGFKKSDIKSNYKFNNLPDHSDEHIYNNLYDVLDDKVDVKYYLSNKLLNTLKKHKQRHSSVKSGFGYVIVNQGDNPISNTIMATGGSGKERNLIKQYIKEYNGMIVGRGNIINNEGIRNMTPNEWGKLQGFINYAFINDQGEDTFSFPNNISDAQKYKLFGNSVVIPIIKSIAEYMAKTLDDLYE